MHLNKCHTLARNDPQRCEEIDKVLIRNFKQSSWVYHRHHLLQNNEFCVKETVLFEFYHLSNSNYHYFSVISLIILIISMI